MCLVTRADLPLGAQAAQAAHAGLEFTITRPHLLVRWDGALILLTAPDELALCWLLAECQRTGVPAASFHEPDLGGELTAVAILGASKRLTARYPLLGKEQTNDHARRSTPPAAR